MRLVSQNVQSRPRMSAARVSHDILISANEAGIVGWQEIGPASYKDNLRATLGEHWETHFPTGKLPNGRGHVGAEAISWRHKYWSKVDAGGAILHFPVKDVCHQRYISWALLERVGSEQRQVLVNNVHYVAGAFSKRNAEDEGLSHTSNRRKMWEEANERHREFIKEWVDKDVPIAGTGDFNRREFEIFGDVIGGRRVHYTAEPLGIDLTYLINGGDWVWDVKDVAIQKGRYSDHQGRLVEAYMNPREKDGQ